MSSETTRRRDEIEEAATRKDLKEIKRIILNKPIDGDSESDNTEELQKCLQEAARDDCVQCVKYLIEEHDIQLDWTDNDGNTALLSAMFSNSEESANILLENGASASLSNNAGYTPLILAAENSTVELVQKLIAYGAIVDKKIKEYNHLPMYQDACGDGDTLNKCQTSLIAAIKNNRVDVAKILLEARPGVLKKCDGDRNTPLMRAIYSGAEDCVDLLLNNKAPVNAKNVFGQTALFIAVQNEQVSISRKLIEKGANVNYIGNDKTTLLHEAAQGNPQLVNMIIDTGKIKDTLTQGGYHKTTPLMNLLYYFKKPKSDSTKTDSSLIKSLKLKEPNSCRNQAIMRLLKCANKTNMAFLNSTEETHLMIASTYGDIDCILLLIEAGSPLNFVNSRGKSALSLAVWSLQLDAVRVLLQKGADPNMKHNGNYVLYQQQIIANSSEDTLSIIKAYVLLIQYGMVVCSKFGNGTTICEYFSSLDYENLKMWKFLYYAGFLKREDLLTLQQNPNNEDGNGNQELSSWLMYASSQPMSLLCLTRIFTRSVLTASSKSCQLSSQLQLPEELTKFLDYEEFES